MSTPVAPSFSGAHRLYVKSLYKRYLVNSLNWYIRRDLWRNKAIEIRAEFERHRNVTDPRALAALFETMEAKLAKEQHPDPYRPPMFPDGTKWERNLPPPMFTEDAHHAEPAVEEPAAAKKSGKVFKATKTEVATAKATFEAQKKPYTDADLVKAIKAQRQAATA